MPRNWPLLALGLLLTVSGTAAAITTDKFDAMPCDARDQYLFHLMMGAQEGLDQHNTDGAAKLKAVMTSNSEQFYEQFYGNLQDVRDVNAANATQPNNGGHDVFQVEHAFAVTAKQNGISIPVSYLLTVNQNFVPKPPLTYASEPVWPWNVSASYKQAVLELMASTNRVNLSYQDMRCQLNEQTYIVESKLAKAPSLSEKHHAYVTKAGTLVDERGTRLTGVDLQKVSALKNGSLPSFEDLKSAQARLARIHDLQNKMVAAQTEADDNWDKAVKEMQDCFPMKCTYKN